MNQAAFHRRFGYTHSLRMTKNTSHSSFVDLSAIAHHTLIEAGFVPDWTDQAEQEVRSIVGQTPPTPSGSVRDLRALLWSSIDDSKSRDLDQVEYAEMLANGDARILVGIADVDARVAK